MKDLNRATILGRLTRDPEVRNTQTGKTVATLSVATNRTWLDQAGVQQELPEYHTCVLWGKIADIAGQYLVKGRRIYLEGRLQTRDWTGQDGVKRYRTEVVVDNMIMLDGGAQSKGTSSASGAALSQHADDSSAPPSDSSPTEEIKVEDIPF